jgi:hypothetical protein
LALGPAALGLAILGTGLAPEIHVAAGDQSLSVGHIPIVWKIPYDVNRQNIN